MATGSAHATPPPEPWMVEPRRQGNSPVERKALGKMQREVASMPASLVVQIALWPVKLSDWARQRRISSAMVYNCLAGTKPYEPVRDMLAESLGVSRHAIDRLIDAQVPPPLSLVPPDPLPETASEAPPVTASRAPASPPPVKAGVSSAARADVSLSQIRLDL